jgi:hypothetical protein
MLNTVNRPTASKWTLTNKFINLNNKTICRHSSFWKKYQLRNSVKQSKKKKNIRDNIVSWFEDVASSLRNLWTVTHPWRLINAPRHAQLKCSQKIVFNNLTVLDRNLFWIFVHRYFFAGFVLLYIPMVYEVLVLFYYYRPLYIYFYCNNNVHV